MNYLIEIENLGIKTSNNGVRATFCKYKCKCGNIIEAKKTLVIHNRTKSCGCLKIETTRNILIKRNTSHGLSKHPLYKKWKDMKARCYNVNNKEYKNYGERGITICEEWEDNFLTFYNWSTSNGYKDGLTIDRINVNGNYSPENCRWNTMKEQSNNRRNTIYMTVNDETHSLSEWASITGIKYDTLWKRYKKYGWSPERVVS